MIWSEYYSIFWKEKKFSKKFLPDYTGVLEILLVEALFNLYEEEENKLSIFRVRGWDRSYNPTRIGV